MFAVAGCGGIQIRMADSAVNQVGTVNVVLPVERTVTGNTVNGKTFFGKCRVV